MLMVPPPLRPWEAVENWLESPRTGPEIGRVLMMSRMEGEPRFSRSSWFRTATGMAVSLGVPWMKEPVTTTSSTVFAFVSWAWAAPAIMRPAATAIADAP